MKTTLVAGVAAALLATATPASAHDYAGSCSAHVVADGTSGPDPTWTGTVTAFFVATTTGNPPTPSAVPISFECHLRINGVFAGVVAAGSGPGVAVGAGSLTYRAAPADIVEVCDVVDVDGNPHYVCAQPTTTR